MYNNESIESGESCSMIYVQNSVKNLWKHGLIKLTNEFNRKK